MSVIKLKPKLCTTYIELCKNFGRKNRLTDRTGCLILNINIIILKSKLLRQIT